MKKFIYVVVAILLTFSANAQKDKKKVYGMYIQWGYNMEWYTNSNVHFRLANGDNFTLYKAKAHDKPDFDVVFKKPAEVSIPQYNYRVGFYVNSQKTKAVEINFDHIKYVLTDGQKVSVKGVINNQPVDGDSILNPTQFLHLEHTDGGNLLHINYVQQNTILRSKYTHRPLLNLLWKAGAGINIPRTDFTYHGQRLNNKFHIAGYNFGAEGGARIYPFHHFFIEATGKTGYVRYINALANTPEMKGNRVHHGFGYFEMIATLGVDVKI